MASGLARIGMPAASSLASAGMLQPQLALGVISFADEAAGGAEDELSNDETVNSTCGGLCCEIDVTGCELLYCKTCGSKCIEPTPLTSPKMVAKLGRYRPWVKYHKIKEPVTRQVIKKIPRSCQCGICLNTFNALGLNVQYTNLGDFQKQLSVPAKQQEGPKFVRARRN